MNDSDRDRFLTARWNNILALSLGFPILVLVFVTLTTESLSDRAAFIGLVVLSAFF